MWDSALGLRKRRGVGRVSLQLQNRVDYRAEWTTEQELRGITAGDTATASRAWARVRDG